LPVIAPVKIICPQEIRNAVKSRVVEQQAPYHGLFGLKRLGRQP
jgi:hypothetical protein